MTVKIKAYSDFICPFCFLGKGPLDEIVKEKDVEVEWMPFELRPSPYTKIDPWKEPDKLNSWDSYILPVAKKLGVDMRLPRVSPHPYTHLAFEGCHFAKEHGKGNEFHNRVFRTGTNKALRGLRPATSTLHVQSVSAEMSTSFLPMTRRKSASSAISTCSFAAAVPSGGRRVHKMTLYGSGSPEATPCGKRSRRSCHVTLDARPTDELQRRSGPTVRCLS